MAIAFTVELRIKGKDLDPQAITDFLGLTPTYTCRLGESPNPRGCNTATWGYGSGSPTRKWESLEDGFNANLRELLRLKAKIVELSTKNKVFWWCGCFETGFSGGPTFSPELLVKLADFGVELILDCYHSDKRPT